MTGAVVWITGKPSSGKSTLGRAVARALGGGGLSACMLDGDEVRAALVPKPGYDATSRSDFYSTLGNFAALLARQGLVVVVAATAHAREYRRRARAQAPAYLEVLVDASQAEVEARDTKGLYAAVRAGRLRDVPGADLDYEPPERPDVVARGGHDSRAVDAVVAKAKELCARD